MSKKSAVTQIFKIRQSPYLIKWLYTIHTIAFVTLFFNALALAYKTVLILSILVSLFIYIKRELGFEGLTIRHAESIGWELALTENQFNPIQVLPSTVINTYFVVFHYISQNQQKRAILICKDALKNDDFRKLLVELKISGLSKDNL